MRRLTVALSIFFGALILWTAGCGNSNDSSECGADDDCKGDRICEDGACEDPGGGSGGDGSSGGSSGGTTSDGSSGGTSSGGTSGDGTSSGGSSGGSTGGECMEGADCDTVVCECSDGPVNYQGCFNGTCATKDDCFTAAGPCDEGGGSGSGSGGSSGGTSGGSTGGGTKEIGDSCDADEQCKSGWCIYGPNASVGYCSTDCESFSDCPSFWECKEIEGATNKFCVKDE